MKIKTNYKGLITILSLAVITAALVLVLGPDKTNQAFKPQKNTKVIHIDSRKFLPIDSNQKLAKDKARLLVVENFHANKLNNNRSLHIYLPPSYYESKDKKFPVLYVQDGKSVFDISDWSKETLNMHTTADDLISKGKIKDIIIVGIDNIGENRISEYAHWDGVDMGKPVSGTGLLYEDFVINDVKPFIDENFRTLSGRENTALMGASIGGLAAFNIGFRRPEVFGMLAMQSPYFIWGGDRLYNELRQGTYKDKQPFKMWIDAGAKEINFRDMTAGGVSLLLDNGYKYLSELAVYEDPEGEHSERFWARRVESILIYFYGDIGKPQSVEAFVNDKIHISGSQLQRVNAVVTYDSGFKTTDIYATYEVENPEILKVNDLGGLLTPLNEGTTKVTVRSSTGLSVQFEITVVL